MSEIKYHIKQDVQLRREHKMDTHSAGRRRCEGYLMCGGGGGPEGFISFTVINFDLGTCS